MDGKIYSIESMGLVDGPGIRTVVFLQGCALRCQFCHNPDSWDCTKGQTLSAQEVVDKIVRFKPYFSRSGGGVTLSGGEPLMQRDFCLELLTKCKQAGIHTCLDTAGVGVGGYEQILAQTDLVLYDVKAIDEDKYRALCGTDMQRTQQFLRALKDANTPCIVRQVVIPNYNDDEGYMQRLRQYVKEYVPTAYKVELLPYHKMGVHKYGAIGIADPLADVPPMDKQKTEDLQARFFNGRKHA